MHACKRCTPVREMHAYETHAYKMHANEMHAYKMYACKRYTPLRSIFARCIPMRDAVL
jgi:hypothetical protein